MIARVFDGFGYIMFEVFLALLPVIVIFILLQIFSLKLKKRAVLKMMVGFVITYIGLVFFLQGVNIAFIPIGEFLGTKIAQMKHNYILIPIGFVMGFVVAFAEPAVRVLNHQVFELSAGSIKQSMLLFSISIGVAVAVALAMVRIIAGFSLWWFVLPGYIIIFSLVKYVDPTFVAIAFDSGGVATGPMCSTFVLSFSLAVSKAIGRGNPMTDGLGMVALVAMAPIISIMTVSYLYSRQAKRGKKVNDGGKEECSV